MLFNKLGKKGKWALICLASVLVGAFLFHKAIYLFSPGSYPFSEDYEFNISENELIKAIDEFRIENPQYYPPFDVGSLEGRKDSTDYWYHYLFYYNDKNQILHCWVRGGTKKTTFAFVAINDGLILRRWKMVNDDFGFFENRRVIKTFEDRILNKIKEIIKRQKNGNS